MRRASWGCLLFTSFVFLSACGRSPTTPSTSSTSSTSTGVKVSGPQGVLIPGETVQLKAAQYVTTPPNYTETDKTTTATWLSSDPSVATVSSTGLVTAVAPGLAGISATVQNLMSPTIGIRVATSRAAHSGQIDPDVAADIIAWNQNQPNVIGNPSPGIIVRFELPIPVYVDTAFVAAFADCAQRAVRAWQAGTGLPVQYVNQNVEPRVQWVIEEVPDYRPITRPVSFNLDNSSRLMTIVMPTSWAPHGPANCDDAALNATTHEFGHALGIGGHPDWGGVMAYQDKWTGWKQPNAREFRLITALYNLPLGAHVNADGTWFVK